MSNKEGKSSGAMPNYLTCSLDPAAFSRIFNSNISGDIECVHQSLLTYMSFVRESKDRKGELSQSKLKKFLVKYEQGINTQTIEMLDGFFEATHLIFGGEKGYLKENELGLIVDFLKLFNKEIIKVSPFFKRQSKINYPGHIKERTRVLDAFYKITYALKDIIDSTAGNNTSVNFPRFIDYFFKYGDQDLYNKMTKLFFAKKILVDGKVEILERQELRDFMLKLPKLASIAFDMININKTAFSEAEGDFINLLYQDVDDLKKIIKTFKPSEVMFNVNDLLIALDEFLEPSLDIKKYVPELVELKRLFLVDRKTENFEFAEWEKLLSEINTELLRGKYFFRIYKFYEDKLNTYCDLSQREIDCPVSIDFSDYPAHTSLEALFKSDFARIIYNYRFFKGNNESPIYDRLGFHRNILGVYQISLMEVVIEKVFKDYGGRLDSARARPYAMSLDGDELDGEKGVHRFVKQLEQPLTDIGIIIPGRKFFNEYIKTGENLMLMSTLFQYQANGGRKEDGLLEIPEIVEFLMTVLVALDTRESVQSILMGFCSDPEDRVCMEDDPNNCPRVKVSCLRKNFKKLLYEELPSGKKFSSLLPSLTDYIEDLDRNDPDELDNFYAEVETFTRTCTHYEDGSEVPISENDMLAIFAGLLNIESTMIQFDKNKNNYMDVNEVETAFNNVYRGAIEAMIKEDISSDFASKKLAKPVFQFLVKHKMHPTKPKANIGKFAKFLAFDFRKKQPAKRATIAAILRVLGDAMPQNPFYCCRFRNSITGQGSCTPEEIKHYDSFPKPDNIP